MKLFLLCSLLIGALSLNGNEWQEDRISNLDSIDHKSAFKNWQMKFNKKYTDLSEESHRYNIFLNNWKMINNHNLYSNKTYLLGLNQFGDLLPDEFRYQVHGHLGSCLKKSDKKNIRTNKNTNNNIDTSAAPTSIDWTNINGKSYVTPIKNQGQCGSCWAFAVVANTESRHAIKYNLTDDAILTLSEQQIVDCSTSNGDNGCNGGQINPAYNYIKSTHGLCTEKEYPYLGTDHNKCKDNSCGTKYYPISGYTDATSDNEVSMLQVVAQGPTTVCIEADQSAFQFYKTGVLDGTCGTSTDHCVQVVGYGHASASNMDYWKVKNSWGTSWGMEGYVLICRNCKKNGNKGECGINMYPSYGHPQ
eukprot:342616_1